MSHDTICSSTRRRGTRCGVATCLATLAVAALSAPLAAQTGAVYAEIRGRVFLAGDTVSLPGALIEQVGGPLSATAGRDGSYRLRGVPIGQHEFRVRLIGLSSRVVTVHVDAPGVRIHDIAMSRRPNTLSEVRINGRMTRVPPRFDDVYRRMHTQTGTFFTSEDVRRINPYDMLSLLAWVPTARVSDQGVSFAKCTPGGAYALSVHKKAPSGVQIYIDGFRLTLRGTAEEQRDVFLRVHPKDIEAVEVYSGVARIPGEFLNDACAVVAIWTR